MAQSIFYIEHLRTILKSKKINNEKFMALKS